MLGQLKQHVATVPTLTAVIKLISGFEKKTTLHIIMYIILCMPLRANCKSQTKQGIYPKTDTLPKPALQV